MGRYFVTILFQNQTIRSSLEGLLGISHIGHVIVTFEVNVLCYFYVGGFLKKCIMRPLYYPSFPHFDSSFSNYFYLLSVGCDS